jgi:Arc/MetJ-type ribon-helix-helix transcriptional regulator
MNISFPDDLYFLIHKRIDEGAYASASEYVRALVRDDLSRNGDARRRQPKRMTIRRANDHRADL